MKKSLVDKLDLLSKRYHDLAGFLSDAEVIAEQKRFVAYSKEYAELEPVVKAYMDYQSVQHDLETAKAMLQDQDPDLRAMAVDEQNHAKEHLARLDLELKRLLIPKDPNDQANVYLEIRAGTGGDEAAIFVGDLFRMYSRYVELKGWQLEIINLHEGDHGGYKEVISRIEGNDVFARLKYESGAHRVQRVPETESQGRIHTSACTVAVLPEPGALEKVEINKAELRIDTFRASGAGGQHVNKTDSAIRITHLPTGIVVECQDERSQHKNRAKAMALLQAKLMDEARISQEKEQTEKRRSLVGSGDRSERIRTYNFPQGRVTDHRINLTLYQLNDVMEGQLEGLIQPLIQEDQANKLVSLDQSVVG